MKPATHALLLLLLVIFVTNLSIADDVGSSNSLTLSVEVETETIELGESLPFKLNFTTNSTEPFFLQFSGVDYGPEALNIVLALNNCEYSVEPVHFDRMISDHRFDFIPLSTGDRFERTLSLGDFRSKLPMLKVPRPGTYRLWVTYKSSGPAIEGTFWPVWRGQVKSAETKISLNPPNPNVIQSQLVKLKNCLNKSPCEEYEAVWYFGMVRISNNADELVNTLKKILDREPTGPLSSFLAEAIVNQSRKGDASYFESLASRPEIESSTQQYYRGLSKRLKNLGPCDL